MIKGSIRHIQFEITVLAGSVSEINHKKPSTSQFYLNWKIIQNSQNRQIDSKQYVQPNQLGVINFNTQLKTIIRLVFNADTNLFQKKKSMLCLNYIDGNNNQVEPKLAGMVTVDLSDIVSKSSDENYNAYSLERSKFKQSTITLKFVTKKLKESSISSLSWQSKQLSIENLLESVVNKHKRISQKKALNPRKKTNKLTKERICQIIRIQGQEHMKDILEESCIQTQLKDQEQQNQESISHHQYQKSNTSGPSTERLVTFEQQLDQNQGQTININLLPVQYDSLVKKNKQVVNELQKVSLLLINREKEIHVLKSELNKLKVQQHKKTKPSKQLIELQQQCCYLSAEVMRLHQELAYHRQTQIQNNQLKKQNKTLLESIQNLKVSSQRNNIEIQGLHEYIGGLGRKQQIAEQSSIDQGTLTSFIHDLISQSKTEQKTTPQLVQHFKLINKQTLQAITNQYENIDINTIRNLSNWPQKINSKKNNSCVRTKTNNKKNDENSYF